MGIAKKLRAHHSLEECSPVSEFYSLYIIPRIALWVWQLYSVTWPYNLKVESFAPLQICNLTWEVQHLGTHEGFDRYVDVPCWYMQVSIYGRQEEWNSDKRSLWRFSVVFCPIPPDPQCSIKPCHTQSLWNRAEYQTWQLWAHFTMSRSQDALCHPIWYELLHWNKRCRLTNRSIDIHAPYFRHKYLF